MLTVSMDIQDTLWIRPCINSCEMAVFHIWELRSYVPDQACQTHLLCMYMLLALKCIT